MAFPTYPYGYQPQYYPQPMPDQLSQLRQQQMQTQMMQQPVPQQIQPPMMQPAQMPAANQPIQNNGISWVGSKQEADNYPISPGCAVALWDSNNPVIYLRQADSTGKPSTKVYDLVERQENQPARAPQLDPNQYVTWEKLDEYLAERLKRPSRAAQKKEDTDNG